MSHFFELFKPNQHVKSVTDIDPIALKRDGIDALLIDLDNTLVPWRSMRIYPQIADWVDAAKNAGLGICIVSNASSRKRIQKLAEDFGVEFASGALKPGRSGFLDGMRILGATPEQSAVIGDQVFTDILGGNRLGLRTILVDPMHHWEFIGTKLSRIFEILVLKILGARTHTSVLRSNHQGTIEANKPSDENGGLN